MRETWRWFGPLDKISLEQVRHTGASGIVTALHHVPYGDVWQSSDIESRKSAIERAGLTWDVVESVPVHENIKRGDGNLDTLFSNYRQTLKNLSAAGITTVCYNFMPVLDWTRTTLKAPVVNGGTALRFEMAEYAAFDMFMLGRESNEHSDETIAAATKWWESANEAQQENLTISIMSGLPGAYQRYDASGLAEELEKWSGFTADDLRSSLARFVTEIMPTAAELGVKMCVHPDDPPRHLFGLPRIFSSQKDFEYLACLDTHLSNGITLCAGSLGANPKNDVAEIAKKFADRIHFAHLRNVASEPDGSFQESEHLDGDVDLVAVVANLLDEEARRRGQGRSDVSIPFRPDHGHELLNDSELNAHPGYPLIGRLRGLAEIRGTIAGLGYSGARA